MHYNQYSIEMDHKTLAWHETLELHELVVFQSIGLMKLKDAIGKITCPTLRAIYAQTIKGLTMNLTELLQFYSNTPRNEQIDRGDLDKGFYAGDLLAFSKTAVRNYAIAITETATPQLRMVFAKHLQSAIHTHAIVFNYMYERGYYPSYNLPKLLNNDVMLAKKAISMR